MGKIKVVIADDVNVIAEQHKKVASLEGDFYE